jgi:hypothetical protein
MLIVMVLLVVLIVGDAVEVDIKIGIGVDTLLAMKVALVEDEIELCLLSVDFEQG